MSSKELHLFSRKWQFRKNRGLGWVVEKFPQRSKYLFCTTLGQFSPIAIHQKIPLILTAVTTHICFAIQCLSFTIPLNKAVLTSATTLSIIWQLTDFWICKGSKIIQRKLTFSEIKVDDLNGVVVSNADC
jgi:hypothetical protein